MRCELLACFTRLSSSKTAMSVTLTVRQQAGDKQSCNLNIITGRQSCWPHFDANKQNTSFPNCIYPYLLRVKQQKLMLHVALLAILDHDVIRGDIYQKSAAGKPCVVQNPVPTSAHKISLVLIRQLSKDTVT